MICSFVQEPQIEIESNTEISKSTFPLLFLFGFNTKNSSRVRRYLSQKIKKISIELLLTDQVCRLDQHIWQSILARNILRVLRIFIFRVTFRILLFTFMQMIMDTEYSNHQAMSSARMSNVIEIFDGGSVYGTHLRFRSRIRPKFQYQITGTDSKCFGASNKAELKFEPDQ